MEKELPVPEIQHFLLPKRKESLDILADDSPIDRTDPLL